MRYLAPISLMVIGLILSPINHVHDGAVLLIGGGMFGLGITLLLIAIVRLNLFLK